MSSRKQPTQLYSELSDEQQAKFQHVVIEQLKTLIGGHRELSVLAEYIAVMLQSNRPPEQIESELEAFLQEQSKPFTAWLCKELSKLTGKESSGGRGTDAKGEALLMRAVADARQGATGEADTGKRSRRKEKAAKEAAALAGAPPARERRRAAAAAAAAAAAEAEQTGRGRSRSRPRRRQEKLAAREAALREVPNGNSAGSREAAEKRKALLTPNVQFLRDAYHSKVDAQHADAPPPDQRWTYRAEGPAPHGAAGAGLHQAPDGMPPGAAAPGFPPGAIGGPVMTVKNRYFPPKKWKVARKDTVVRATERLDSEKVHGLLQVGEIVEQVAPAFKMPNGIVRIQIRHPSSPQFPNPIGWVTQDATSAGGPKFLEPGPEPMVKNSGWRPSTPAWQEEAPAWRPKGKGCGKGAMAVAPARPAGPGGFTNLTWTPS